MTERGDETAEDRERWENWSGGVTATPERLVRPETVADLQRLVADHGGPGPTIRAAGAGHSFPPLVATDDTVVATDRYTGVVDVAPKTRQATVRAGTTLESMNRELARHGLAVENMGDIDQQRLAGALATGTHGTGAAFGVLATQAVAMDLVTADGSLRRLTPDDGDRFRAAQVSLGALGLVSTVTLQLQDAYTVRLERERVDLETLLERVEAEREANRHVEFFWYPADGDEARVKRINRVDAEEEAEEPTDADETEVGPSHEVFPSVRERRFEEMEYGLPAEEGPVVFRKIRAIVEDDPEIRFPVEYRYVASDDIPLSPAHGRDSVFVAVHRGRGEPYEEFFAECEAVFREHGGRPHWGKHHDLAAADLEALYPEWDTFHDVRRDLDPEGVFTNDYLAGLFD